MSDDTFMGLLAPNLQPLRKLLQARLKNPGQADDVLQQALLRAFINRDQLRLGSKFRSWLWTIAFNEMRMFFRRERVTISLDEFPNIDPSDRAPSPLVRIEQIEKEEWLHAGLASLSSRDRTAIRLLDLHGLSVAETSVTLAISNAAVRSTHFRARKRLSSALRRASRPVVYPAIPSGSGSGKKRVRNATSAETTSASECIDSTNKRKQTNAY